MTDEVNSYDIETTIKVTELNEQTVTYQIYNYSFTGGAHPNYAYVPFTYDLSAGKVLTFDLLFKPGSDAKLQTLIEEALANQLGVSSPAKLGNAGIFMDQMFVSHNVFVSDGQIVFHYNPYDIGPYALGQIDVPLKTLCHRGSPSPPRPRNCCLIDLRRESRVCEIKKRGLQPGLQPPLHVSTIYL